MSLSEYPFFLASSPLSAGEVGDWPNGAVPHLAVKNLGLITPLFMLCKSVLIKIWGWGLNPPFYTYVQ